MGGARGVALVVARAGVWGVSGEGRGGVGLPKGWAQATIGEVCEINPSNSPLPDDEQVSFVPMAAVSELEGTIATAQTRSAKDVKIGFTSFAEGDVIFAKITPCMENGKSAVARGLVGGRGFGSTEFFVLRSCGPIVPELLHKFVRQQSYREAARATMKSGVGQARVPKDFVSHSAIPIPPIAEQRRIVAKLDELLARSRSTREALTAVLPLLDRYRESVLTNAFRGFLTEAWRLETGAPSAWRTVRLGEVLRDVRYGTSKKCHHEPVDVPVLRIPNVASGFISHEDMKYASFDETEMRQLALRRGDILMIRSNGSLGLVGRTAVVTERDEGLLYAGYLIRLRVNMELADSQYLSTYLAAPGARSGIERTSRSTTGVNNINAEEIRNIPVSLPPLPEQQEIVRRVDAAFARIAAVRQLVEAQLARLDALDRSILARAFRGELVPQDPSDEPASALLDRIRAERAAAPAKAARRGRSAAR